MHRAEIKIKGRFGGIVFQAVRHEEAPNANIKARRKGDEVYFEIERRVFQI